MFRLMNQVAASGMVVFLILLTFLSIASTSLLIDNQKIGMLEKRTRFFSLFLLLLKRRDQLLLKERNSCKTMPELKPKPTLADFQTYVVLLEKERGFSEQNVQDKCLLLGEEVGELFKAIRKQEGVKIDVNSKFGSIDEELADILIYLCAIANRYDIDLETAFRNKEKINHQRVWS
jgi:NTP pyrophosphatase (non-canonical NTP hydrolase)